MLNDALMANSVDQDQTVYIGAVCPGSTLSASTLNSSVMLGNYLQQTTLALRVKICSDGRTDGWKGDPKAICPFNFSMLGA